VISLRRRKPLAHPSAGVSPPRLGTARRARRAEGWPSLRCDTVGTALPLVGGGRERLSCRIHMAGIYPRFPHTFVGPMMPAGSASAGPHVAPLS
jgi:hypothetical protein